MPRTVTAGRAQSMSETVPEPSSLPPSTMPASTRKSSGGYGAPAQVWVLSSPVIVVLPSLVAQRGQDLDQRGQRVGRRAAEHPGVHLGGERLHPHHDVDHPAQAHGHRRVADGRVAGVADQDRVGAQQVGVAGHELLEPAGAHLLGALDDELEVDRDVVTERPQRGQVHDDVALAVRRSAAVPAAAHLGELERRGPPGGVVERRLHVVVRVEQHRRRVRVAARPGADHGHAAVGRLLEVGVGEAALGERVQHPLGCPGALLGRVLPGVGDGRDRHQLGQVGAGLRHQVPYGGPGGLDVHRLLVDQVVVEVEVVDELLEVLELVGAVDRDDRDLLPGPTHRPPRLGRAPGSSRRR